MQHKIFLPALCLLLLLPNSNILAQETSPILHAISSKELRDIMRRMNQLVYEREMTALQKQEIRTKKLEDLVDTISELVNSADGMTKALPGLKLNKHDQITFRAMANQLLDEAKNIRQFAENNDYLSVESVYQDLDDTCNACHRLFRY